MSAAHPRELVQRKLESAAESPRAASIALLVLILLYFILTAFAAARHLWHDELYTLYISTAPSLARLWKEIPLDLNPPLEYLAVRASTELFGESAYAVRLPSILAFLAGSLCLYRFAARRFNSWYGLLAMLVFWASPFFYYATEARPYALVIGFLGLTLLLWQRTIGSPRNATTLLLLGLAVTGMMLSHLMAVFYVAPFCLAELVSAYRSRKIDLALWAALLVPCAIPFIFLHLVARFEASVFPVAFQASLRRIAETYYGSLKLEALPLLLALGLAWMVAGWARPETADTRPQPTDLTLTFGFISIPALVNLVLLPSHGAYFDRYAFPVALGYALLIVIFLADRTGRNRVAAIAAGAVLLLFVCGFNLGPGLKASVWSRHGAKADGPALDQVKPDLPLVAASGLTFLEMDHYEDARTVARLYYLTDRGLAIRYAHATIFEGMREVKAYFPIRAHVEPYSEFVTAHPIFLVLGTPSYPEDWLLRALVDRHAQVQYLGDFPGPYKDTQLYQVTLAAR